MMGKISHSCTGELVGRLSLPKTSISWKFARAQMRPLHQKLRRRMFDAQLAKRERCAVEWRRRIVADFTPG